MFDSFAISINGPRAWDLDVAVDVTFLDAGTNYRLTLRNGVLVYRKVPADEATAAATVKLANKLRLLMFATGDTDSPGLGGDRRRRRAAVHPRGARPAQPELQHRHAVAGLVLRLHAGLWFSLINDPGCKIDAKGCRRRRAESIRW